MSASPYRGLRIFCGGMSFFIALSGLAAAGIWAYREHVVKPTAATIEQVCKSLQTLGSVVIDTVFSHEEGTLSCTIHGTEHCSRLVTLERTFTHTVRFDEETWGRDVHASLTVCYRVQAGLDLQQEGLNLTLRMPEGNLTDVALENLAGRAVVFSCEPVSTVSFEYNKDWTDKSLPRLSPDKLAEMHNQVNREAREKAFADEELKRKAEECAREYLQKVLRGERPAPARLDS